MNHANRLLVPTLLLCAAASARADIGCGFKPLDPKKQPVTSGDVGKAILESFNNESAAVPVKSEPDRRRVARAGALAFHFLGASEDFALAEGPVEIYRGKERICVIPEGIFSFHAPATTALYSKSRNLLMLDTYSGSSGTHAIYDLKTCGKTSSVMYTGDAKFDRAGKLVKKPFCTAANVDGSHDYCGAGTVWTLDRKTCAFAVDTKSTTKINRAFKFPAGYVPGQSSVPPQKPTFLEGPVSR